MGPGARALGLVLVPSGCPVGPRWDRKCWGQGMAFGVCVGGGGAALLVWAL